MPITKAAGNMYDWITHTHSHLRGACPHACPYCYVQAIDRRFNSTHHQGPLRIVPAELLADYSAPRIIREAREMGHRHPVIFVDHTNDLFADATPAEWIRAVFSHCIRHPENTYVFQTKNPARLINPPDIHVMPLRLVFGITVESDITHVGETHHPLHRLHAFRAFNHTPKFITIEPVLKFSPAFADHIIHAHPDFVNIGADSKHTPDLPEPTAAELRDLIERLTAAGIEIRSKRNLARLLTV